jgi:hypothetical protein
MNLLIDKPECSCQKPENAVTEIKPWPSIRWNIGNAAESEDDIGRKEENPRRWPPSYFEVLWTVWKL